LPTEWSTSCLEKKSKMNGLINKKTAAAKASPPCNMPTSTKEIMDEDASTEREEMTLQPSNNSERLHLPSFQLRMIWPRQIYGSRSAYTDKKTLNNICEEICYLSCDGMLTCWLLWIITRTFLRFKLCICIHNKKLATIPRSGLVVSLVGRRRVEGSVWWSLGAVLLVSSCTGKSDTKSRRNSTLRFT